MTYQIININNTQELVKHLYSYENNWIFRGHTNANWELETTLERLLKPIGWQGDLAKRCEDYSLRQFQSRAHHYISKDLIPETTLSWLSLMQHHGVPTRLLDFTKSPFFALYFAFNEVPPNQPEPCSIWAINSRQIIKDSVSYLTSNLSDFKFTYEEALYLQDSIFNQYIYGSSHNILWITEPKVFNLRLERQKGTFVLCADITRRIKDILEEYKEEYVHKIIIPATLTREIFKILTDMGIDNCNLFADLDGLGSDVRRTLKHTMPHYYIEKTHNT